MAYRERTESNPDICHCQCGCTYHLLSSRSRETFTCFGCRHGLHYGQRTGLDNVPVEPEENTPCES